MSNTPAASATTCPRCSGPLQRGPLQPALSRMDSTTRVCSACGTAEAMCDFTGAHPWPTYPHPLQTAENGSED